MTNMSYCRFFNTLEDLRVCEEHIEDMDLSPEENRKRIALIKLCRDIASQFEDEDLEEYFEKNGQEEDEEEYNPEDECPECGSMIAECECTQEEQQ